jgi:hypothetical protein
VIYTKPLLAFSIVIFQQKPIFSSSLLTNDDLLCCHHYHSNECHSEPNQLVSNGANIPETMSYKYRQNNHPSQYD